MRRFLIKGLAFFILLVLADIVCGKVLHAGVELARGGDTARNEKIAHQLNDEVLIFGSSRGIYHYDPRVFEDSLHLTCYNCANDGMGILLFYPRYKMLLERYTPKMIIYDVSAEYDLKKGDDRNYLNWLRPYYGQADVDTLFWKVDATERWKMLSQMYRYNGKILQILGDNLKPQNVDIKGYRPKTNVMNYEPAPNVYTQPEFDSLKLAYLEKLIKDCETKGIKLYFVISPYYNGKEPINVDYSPLFKLCNRYQVPLYNFYQDSQISPNRDYFADSYHMNITGSTLFSKKLASILKKQQP